MGNKSTSGIFVPVVKLVRAAMGKKEFNQLRGKGISLHSQGALHAIDCMLVSLSAINACAIQSYIKSVLSATQLICLGVYCGIIINRLFPCCAVIKSFGQRIGADNKQVQGLVRLAKKNGEKLGFLA